MRDTLSQIRNVDQISLCFFLPMHRLDFKSQKMVNKIGKEKKQFMLMLVVTCDGEKLLPYVVKRQKTMPKKIFLKGIEVHVQKKCCFVGLMMCLKHPGGLQKQPYLPVLDESK